MQLQGPQALGGAGQDGDADAGAAELPRRQHAHGGSIGTVLALARPHQLHQATQSDVRLGPLSMSSGPASTGWADVLR